MGLERARSAPDLLPPRADGRPAGRAAVRGRPAADVDGAVGRRMARHRRRLRHLAGERHRPRDHRGRTGERGVRGAGHHRLRRLRGDGEGLHAGPRLPRHRRAGRPHPAAGARLCPRRPGPDLLDPRHHRAPQRGRQRVRAHQPGPAHRPRGPVRLRAGPPARPEQRAGRRRHGGDPQQADRVPGRQDQLRSPGPVRGRLRLADPARARLAPVADVRGHGAGRAHLLLHHRREPAALRGRHGPGPQAPGRARALRGAGHLPHRHGRARRRRAAGHGHLVRGRGDGHQQRAAGPAGAQGAGAAAR